MKKIILLTGILLVTLVSASAQRGKFGGTHKSLLNKTFTSRDSIPGLKGWKMMSGALLNKINDPEFIYADVYRKGTTWLVICSIQEDTAVNSYLIYDVLEVQAVPKGWAIRIADCEQYNQPDPYIIVWGKETTAEYLRTIKKAWRFNPDKRIIETLPIKNIRCVNATC